jgi:hypothetical protein
MTSSLYDTKNIFCGFLPLQKSASKRWQLKSWRFSCALRRLGKSMQNLTVKASRKSICVFYIVYTIHIMVISQQQHAVLCIVGVFSFMLPSRSICIRHRVPRRRLGIVNNEKRFADLSSTPFHT